MQKKWNRSLFYVHFAAQRHSGQKRTESKERLNRTFITITPSNCNHLPSSRKKTQDAEKSFQLHRITQTDVGKCLIYYLILKICTGNLEMRNTNVSNANFVWVFEFFWVWCQKCGLVFQSSAVSHAMERAKWKLNEMEKKERYKREQCLRIKIQK